MTRIRLIAMLGAMAALPGVLSAGWLDTVAPDMPVPTFARPMPTDTSAFGTTGRGVSDRNGDGFIDVTGANPCNPAGYVIFHQSNWRLNVRWSLYWMGEPLLPSTAFRGSAGGGGWGWFWPEWLGPQYEYGGWPTGFELVEPLNLGTEFGVDESASTTGTGFGVNESPSSSAVLPEPGILALLALGLPVLRRPRRA